jgi:hypothetical protein
LVVLSRDRDSSTEGKGSSSSSSSSTEQPPLPASIPEELYILGTAHVSKRSADLAYHVVRAVQPDAVLVELCWARAGIMIGEPRHKEEEDEDEGEGKQTEGERLEGAPAASQQRSLPGAISGGKREGGGEDRPGSELAAAAAPGAKAATPPAKGATLYSTLLKASFISRPATDLLKYLGNG